MNEFTDKAFNEAHSKATGEGVEYIESLALEIASSLTKAGEKINGQSLIDRLNSIVDTDGIDTIKDASLLQTRLNLYTIIETVNPEDKYRKLLMTAYGMAVSEWGGR